MKRIPIVKQYVDNIIENIISTEERRNAYIHAYGVAQCCSIIADKRRLDSELAYISGLLHDIYAYFTGSHLCHAQSGADMARVAIKRMNIFSDDEKKIILSAIFYHSHKELIHDKYDEVLKDAETLHAFLNTSSFNLFHIDVPRLNRILGEFEIIVKPIENGMKKGTSVKKAFKRSEFADIAEELAAKNICGERDNNIYMDIIKYYPEASAFDELKNSWCAAFVYHCALRAGIELPIKQPPFKYRFAGVGTWYEWGKDNGFCFHDNEDFIPSRGDIVIYNNIVSPENKPENSPWHDHTGVVLSCESEYLIVAEGNINNQNVSGIIKRKRDGTIGCFIRIPDDYKYNDYNSDYKEYLTTVI
ncbi:MAG: HD domain-containing protein [Firmicutes bacterium]|nr:HD domain-containing protein [Bacillota bacterium]